MQVLEGILDLLFPPRCGICDRLRRPVLCQDCLQFFESIRPPVCVRCGRPGGSCASCPEVPAPCRAPFLYSGAAGEAVCRLKYERIYELGEALGSLVAERLHEWPEFAEADAVVPVPIHISRERQRTFNQAELIAAPIARALGIPTASDALIRHRRTPPQVGRSTSERRRNILGAFRVPNRGKVSGRTLLLVDDVYTSGSTLRECAEELLLAGAAKTMAITVCREI